MRFSFWMKSIFIVITQEPLYPERTQRFLFSIISFMTFSITHILNQGHNKILPSYHGQYFCRLFDKLSLDLLQETFPDFLFFLIKLYFNPCSNSHNSVVDKTY